MNFSYDTTGTVTFRLMRQGAPAGILIYVDLTISKRPLNHEQLAQEAARRLREGLRDLSAELPIRADGHPAALALEMTDATGTAAA